MVNVNCVTLFCQIGFIYEIPSYFQRISTNSLFFALILFHRGGQKHLKEGTKKWLLNLVYWQKTEAKNYIFLGVFAKTRPPKMRKKNLKILGIFKRWTKIGIPRPIFKILANFVSKIMNRPLRGIVWDWVNGFYCIFNTLYHWRIRWIFSRWFKPIRNCKGPFLNLSASFHFVRPHFSFLLSFNRYSLGVNRIGII